MGMKFKERVTLRQLLISGSLLHFVLNQVYFDFLDWTLMWNLALDLNNGANFYTSQYYVANSPLFVYLLSIIASVWGSQRLGKLIIYIFTLLTLRTILGEFETESEKKIVTLLYFLNPFLITATVVGYYDIVPAYFSLLAILSYRDSHYARSSFLFAIAFLFKLYVIVPAFLFGLYLLKQKKIVAAIKYGAIFVGTSLMTYVPLYLQNPTNFLNRLVLWHFTRNEDTANVIFILLPTLTEIQDFFIFQIILVSLAQVLIVYKYDILPSNILGLFTLSLIPFYLISNIFLTHYLIWIIPHLLIITMKSYSSDKKLVSLGSNLIMISIALVAVSWSYLLDTDTQLGNFIFVISGFLISLGVLLILIATLRSIELVQKLIPYPQEIVN